MVPAAQPVRTSADNAAVAPAARNRFFYYHYFLPLLFFWGRAYALAFCVTSVLLETFSQITLAAKVADSALNSLPKSAYFSELRGTYVRS